MNTSPNNSVLVNKIISMGITDAEVAHKIMAHYLKTGKIISFKWYYNGFGTLWYLPNPLVILLSYWLY
jgi:hypothetical protein